MPSARRAARCCGGAIAGTLPSAPQRRNEAQIEKLDELRFWLGTVFAEDHEAADSWLRTRLIELRGQTPLAVVKRGDLDRVIEMLATYEAGAFV